MNTYVRYWHTQYEIGFAIVLVFDVQNLRFFIRLILCQDLCYSFQFALWAGAVFSPILNSEMPRVVLPSSAFSRDISVATRPRRRQWARRFCCHRCLSRRRLRFLSEFSSSRLLLESVPRMLCSLWGFRWFFPSFFLFFFWLCVWGIFMFLGLEMICF